MQLGRLDRQTKSLAESHGMMDGKESSQLKSKVSYLATLKKKWSFGTAL